MKTRQDFRKTFLSQNLSRAKGRKDGKVFGVTIEYLFQLGEQQDWKCNVSGLPLEFVRGGSTHGGRYLNPYSCSIDRIDSTKGYIINNVQLVCAAVNDMKSSYMYDTLVHFAKHIVEQNELNPPQYGQLVLPGIGDQVQQVLSARGAAKITGKAKDTIIRAINKGKLPATKGKRSFAIKRSDLAQVLDILPGM